MLWMQTYLLCCSVRLGVIVIAFLTLAQLLVLAILNLVMGIEIFDPFVELLENDEYYNKIAIVEKILDWIDKEPGKFIILINVYLFIHIGTCLLAIYGAFKLFKYFLLPFITLEFVRVIICLTFHIVLMIVLKKLINLGVLVAFTLLGGFLILFLVYNWCACVAFFQIINLVYCERYRALYGADPLTPHLPPGYGISNMNGNLFNYNTIENVHVLTTPNGSEIDELKQKNSDTFDKRRKTTHKTQIISVLPANYETTRVSSDLFNGVQSKQQSRKWWNHSKKDRPKQLQTQDYESDMPINYSNWQWSELLMPGAHRRNELIGVNRRWK